mmetsp:Transcript_38079/g.89173  ORF Transcript_38079/g.89173 Transcript_38079/m.89173 type:complete len:246 (+) Transcript_38079:111-848(+)
MGLEPRPTRGWINHSSAKVTRFSNLRGGAKMMTASMHAIISMGSALGRKRMSTHFSAKGSSSTGEAPSAAQAGMLSCRLCSSREGVDDFCLAAAVANRRPEGRAATSIADASWFALNASTALPSMRSTDLPLAKTCTWPISSPPAASNTSDDVTVKRAVKAGEVDDVSPIAICLRGRVSAFSRQLICTATSCSSALLSSGCLSSASCRKANQPFDEGSATDTADSRAVIFPLACHCFGKSSLRSC